jgi:thiol-disulfide isomerase/thioredoxin
LLITSDLKFCGISNSYTKRRIDEKLSTILIKRNREMKKLFIFIVFVNCLFGQTFEVELSELTTLDEDLIHVEILRDKPHKELILPDEVSTYKFLNLFYNWESETDEIVSIAVVQNDSSDILYVDLNNDGDLTNDGKPLVFHLSQNSIWFDVFNQKDKKQKTRLVLNRKPNLPDSIQSRFIDKDGNLLKPFASIYGANINNNNYKGEKRTFFFDDRMSLRRGVLNLEGIKYEIGLFDYNNNGKFNDNKDVLIIDINRDEKLDYLHDEDIFKLNDIVGINNKNYKLSYVDPYGAKIIIEETTEEPTKYFSRWEEINYSDYKYSLEQEFWENKFTDINGNLVDLKNFKGQYLLINFWGEWCMPCREEIPDLIKARNKYSSKLKYISFLKTYNLKKAREFIKRHNVDWVQIELPKDIEEKFKVRGYPTNLLIFPDGVSFLKQGMIKEDFFDKYIK